MASLDAEIVLKKDTPPMLIGVFDKQGTPLDKPAKEIADTLGVEYKAA